MKNKIRIGIVINNKVPSWLILALIKLHKKSHVQKVNFYSLRNDTSDKKIKTSLLLKLYLFLDRLINKKYAQNTLYDLNEAISLLKESIIDVEKYSSEISSKENDILICLDPTSDLRINVQEIRFGILYSNIEYNDNLNLSILFNLVFGQDIFFLHLTLHNKLNSDILCTNYRYYDKSYVKSLYKFDENLTNAVYTKLSLLFENNIDNIISNNKTEGENIFPNKTKLDSIKLFKLLLNFIIEKIRNLILKEQWFLVLSSKKNNETKTLKITPDIDKFWADPFLYSKDDNQYLFYEEYEEETGRGNISYLEIDENLNIKSSPKVIIRKPYHLSYPFIFNYDDNIYMIPESSENKTIELYIAEDFPGNWKKIKNIKENIFALDTTLLYHDGVYWMFTNIKQTQSAASDTNLHLYYTNNPVNGEWIEHPKNPILTSTNKARPAGNIIKKDGKLFRPSQNCTKRYGYGIVINEILKLSKSEYQEKTIENVTPTNNNIIALHTINMNNEDSIVTFDAMKRVNKYISRKNKIGFKVAALKSSTPFQLLLQLFQ